ncbi:helix-turn-helix transcriptional regulator [Mitsuokella jalaludinii]|uniref:helix-turn-helix domain-containing protein n=1 Tax=Mitsuokella jalaludinii TaxID=187979 RepID=UPI002FDA446D
MNKVKLVNLIASKGMTQAELADKAGLSRASVNNLLKHGRRPRLDTVGKIAKALGVKPSELLDL